MQRKELAKAIIDSGKKKKTVARLARMEPWELSKILSGEKVPSDTQRNRLSSVLGKPAHDLFPESEAVAS